LEINSSHKRNVRVRVLDEDILQDELAEELDVPGDVLVCRYLGSDGLCKILRGELTGVKREHDELGVVIDVLHEDVDVV
jgi:hypothetical protein